MIYETRTITLKDGRTAIFRSPTLDDTEVVLDYLKTICTETDFMLREPEECNLSMEEEQEFIRSTIDAPKSFMICCEIDGEFAGNCDLRCDTLLKHRHKGEIGIGLKEKFWGLGIGTKMFEEIIEEGKKLGLRVLQLEYYEGNERGRSLYEKMGFKEVAIIPNAICNKDGSLTNEHIMQLLI